MLTPQGWLGLGVLFLWLLGGKKEAPAATIAPGEPVRVKGPPKGAAELSNGAWAVVEGDIESGTYQRCVRVGSDGYAHTVDDIECKLVLKEWPEVTVPLTPMIRMTEGRKL